MLYTRLNNQCPLGMVFRFIQ